MTDIKLLKIALLENKGDVDSAGKGDFLLRTSGAFEFNEYVKLTYPEADEEDREKILKEACQLIYRDLLEKTHDKFDSVGVWLTVGDQVYENSIAIATMEGIQQYGQEGIAPVYELVKMTLPDSE